jgi:hypothetical protein
MPERTKNLICPVVGGLGMYSMVVQNVEKQTEKMHLYGGYVVARQTETKKIERGNGNRSLNSTSANGRVYKIYTNGPACSLKSLTASFLAFSQ